MKNAFKKITSETLVYGITGTVSKFIGIFLMPIYTRVFEPKDYGILDIILLTVAIMVILLTCGLDNAIFRFVYDTEDRKEQKRIISTIFYLVILISFSACILFSFFVKDFSLLMFSSSQYSNLLLLGLLLILTTLIISFLNRVLRLRFMAKSFAVITVTGLLLTIILNIYFIIFLNMHIFGALLGNIIGQIVQIIISFIILRDNFTLNVNFKITKNLFSFGIPLIPASLAQWSLIYLNRYILMLFAGLSAVGIYTVGYRISSFLVIITGAFQLAWSPFAMSIMNEDNAKETYANIFKYFIVITIAIAAIFTTYAKEIIYIVATPQYLPAYNLIGIIILNFVASGSYFILCIGATIEKRTFDISKAFIFGTLINLVTGLILIPVFGPLGTALSIVIGYFSACICLYLYSQKYYFVPYEIRTVLLIIVCYVILYVISINFSEVLNPFKILSLACFHLFLFFRVLNNQERAFIVSLIKNFKNKISL